MITLTKSFEVSHKAVEVTPSVMAAINAYALTALSPEQVFAGRMKLANDQYDRQDERFPIAYLEQFAKTLPGKSVMRGHNYALDPDGVFYSATVEKDDTGYVLVADYYLLADNPLVPKIQAGISRFVSIGFTYDKRFCDIDGQDYDAWYVRSAGEDYCHHYRGQEYDGRVCTLTYGGDASKAEALEGSFVWLGAQRGAETMRGGPQAMHKAESGDHLHEAKRKFLEETRADQGRKEEGMEKDLAALQDRVKELETQLSASQAKCAGLEPLAADGTAYRAHLAGEIKRLYTSMGQEKTGESLVKRLEGASVAELDECRKEADAAHAEMFAPTGGAQAKGAPVEPVRRSVDEILYGVRPRKEGV